MNTEIKPVKRYFNDRENGVFTPSILIEKCTCGNYPSYYGSCGGFNYYGYFKCDGCNLFATGRHQFPNIGIDNFGENQRNEPKLFVEYDKETNSEDGWNEFIKNLTNLSTPNKE